MDNTVKGVEIDPVKEKLIELLSYFGDCYIAENRHIVCDTKICEIADHLIANGVTLDNHVSSSKWIPVTERLPEDDLVKDSKVKLIKVLVFYKNSMGVPVVRTQIRQKGYRYHRDEWGWVKFEPITHWMPLPEPPKED